MKIRTMTIVPAAGLAALALAGTMVATATASTHTRFTINDTVAHEYSCGVIETTRIVGRATASFDGEGTWVGTSIHFVYDGTFTDPASGRVITQSAHQNVTEADGFVTMRGQGFFLRMAGEGVVLHDVGRLQFDPGDGSTLSATPKVLRIDDPDIDAISDAAVCGMFD